MKEISNQFIADYDTTEIKSFVAETEAEDEITKISTPQLPLAEAFILPQPYTMPMPEEQSLVCGTAFQALVQPYCQGWHLRQKNEEA